MLHRPLIAHIVVRLLVAQSLLAQDPQVESKCRYAVYRADQDTDDVLELYRSDLKKGEDLKLNGELTPGGDVVVEF